MSKAGYLMKTSRDNNKSSSLPRKVQVARDSWCETAWSEITGYSLQLPNIRIDFSQFPKIKVEPKKGGTYSINYRSNHRYVRIPLDSKIGGSRCLVITCSGEKCFFDLCF